MNNHLPTLVELNTSTASRKVFCPHPIGSGLTIYRALAAELADVACFYGLEDPAVYADATFETLPELAALHVQTIRQVQSEGPYLILGVCSGGAIAYEIAYQLATQGEVVERLVMFGTYDLGGFDPAYAERHRFLEKYLFERFLIELHDLDWDGLEAMDREKACEIVTNEIVARNVEHQLPDAAWIRKSLESICMTRAATRRYTAPMSNLDIDLYRLSRGERPAGAHRDWCNLNELTHGKMTIYPHAPELRPGDNILADPLLAPVVSSLRQNAFASNAGDAKAAQVA